MLTQEQQKAHDTIIDWFRSSSRARTHVLTLGGLAGTGKTHMILYIYNFLKRESLESGTRLSFAFLSLTGKAATVLGKKVNPYLKNDDYCGTIHGLLYSLIGQNEKTRELYFAKNEGTLPYDLLIVDEASMINREIFEDLKEYGIPILAIGDHGQLPPIKGEFNLMENPDLKLETIIRQKEGNPIITMARMAREEGKIPYGDYGQGCLKTRKLQVLHDHNFDSMDSMMLCAMNQTRVKMNDFARQKIFGYVEGVLPQCQEPLICLSNNRDKMIFNGQIGTLEEFLLTGEDIASVKINMGSYSFIGNVDVRQFGQKYLLSKRPFQVDAFDFAYCITVWKSQGSEWKNVLLMEEYLPRMDDDTRRRFLYTACTRAKEKMIIFQR